MSQHPEKVKRLKDPDFRLAEVALQRAARKAQRLAREAGLEPVINQPETNMKPDTKGSKSGQG